MVACTLLRDTRPPSVRSGGGSGAPTTTVIRSGFGMVRPLGMASSECPIPIGTIRAPVRAARKAAPSSSSPTTGPSWRMPSGNSTSISPRRSTSSAWARASRSADSRCTGNAPRVSSSRPRNRCFHRLSLAMKNSFRRVTKALNPKSANDRCTGARITGPSTGMFSRPVTFGRNHSPTTVTKMARQMR